jgi:feruloyl esterase
MKLNALLALAFASVLIAVAPSAPAQTTAASDPSSRCASLRRADFSQIPEAPTQIIGARLIEAAGDLPAFCEIRGTIAPNVGIVFKLPIADWNGRFFQAGCGNWCGTIYAHACDDPLRRGYACIATDAGHVARPEDTNWTDGQWAYDNLQAELDYGGRGNHVTSVAGKAIAERFYGSRPHHSYYMGCSYGGHQAMVLAQRFPWDFDGIVGGGAPNSLSALMQQNLWALANAYDENLQPVFSETDIAVLHGAVLSACDMNDGIADGLINDPTTCRIDPTQLTCRRGQRSGCLSSRMAAVAARMYSGPVNSAGQQTSAGGWAVGSELFWRRVYRVDGTGLAALASNYFRYMGRSPDLGAGWDPRSYDFDQDYRRNDVMETLYAADNPDLRRFRDAGGKFINYVGWADLGTIPAEAIDYYETTQRTMGGRAETESFFRMFMIPGALHCRGGEGADSVDFLTYIENWVERDQAPDVMIGARRNEAGQTVFTRPLYPYPQSARYRGAGDPNDAANFEATETR